MKHREEVEAEEEFDDQHSIYSYHEDDDTNVLDIEEGGMEKYQKQLKPPNPADDTIESETSGACQNHIFSLRLW